ncbi:MAG: hypothetical protein GX196_07330 [Clostridiaceae bacterium]|nr:hypothetical protein [Clostridiaceae bacterium]
MLCEKCGKNPANFHYEQNINGEITVYNLCTKCAVESGLYYKTDFNFSSFFQNFFKPDLFIKETLNPQKSCPFCHMTASQFLNLGKFGCGRCYDTFFDEVSSLLKRIHGSDTHVGAFPKEQEKHIMVKRKIDKLKEELNEAILKENYELAAKLRDEIKELQNNE